MENINKVSFKQGILPIYRINEKSIQIFEENYDLCCNFFTDTNDGYKQKKNVYIESSFKIGNDRASFGIRLVNDEIDEFNIDLNTRTFMLEKTEDAFNVSIDKLNVGDKFNFYFKGIIGNLYAEITNITKDKITVEDEDNKVYSIRIKNIISIREVF